MKERPILFNGEMVRAILRDVNPKTQTRRVVKDVSPEEFPVIFATDEREGEFLVTFADAPYPEVISRYEVRCPYGVPGDRLWVRETFCFEKFWACMGVDDYAVTCRYSADGNDRQIYECDVPIEVGFSPKSDLRKYEGKKRPSIFMPRWASRISLEITEVRVQRVQEISEEDAIAEGCPGIECFRNPRFIGYVTDSGQLPQEEFRDLWNSINAKRGFGWDTNPWVWAITFKRAGEIECQS